MERYEWVANAKIVTDAGQKWVLKYYIAVYERGEEPLYGLRVDKCPDEASNPVETETTPPYTANICDILQTAKTFAKNSVTPCVLLEITDEWAA